MVELSKILKFFYNKINIIFISDAEKLPQEKENLETKGTYYKLYDFDGEPFFTCMLMTMDLY